MRKSGPPKHPTIYDLAKLAGVSTGTVSRVLNNSERVNEQTRERVLRVARARGMRPQTAARRRQVALVTTPPSKILIGGYVSCLTQYVAYALASRGVGLMMVPEEETDRLQRELVDGVIAVAWRPQTVELLLDLENTPVVFINRLDLSDRFHTVGTDHEDAGFRVAQHLIEHGHRRPAMAVHRAGWASEAQARGFLRAVEAAGLDVDERLICHIEPDTFPFNEVSRLLKLEADGIWVPGEDMQALRALHALQHVLGRRVPEDVSIVGTENPGISSHTLPPLTALAQPHRELAERAVELLLDLAGDPDAKRNNILLPTRLIERESVLDRNRNRCVAASSTFHA